VEVDSQLMKFLQNQ